MVKLLFGVVTTFSAFLFLFCAPNTSTDYCCGWLDDYAESPEGFQRCLEALRRQRRDGTVLLRSFGPHFARQMVTGKVWGEKKMDAVWPKEMTRNVKVFQKCIRIWQKIKAVNFEAMYSHFIWTWYTLTLLTCSRLNKTAEDHKIFKIKRNLDLFKS